LLCFPVPVLGSRLWGGLGLIAALLFFERGMELPMRVLEWAFIQGGRSTQELLLCSPAGFWLQMVFRSNWLPG